MTESLTIFQRVGDLDVVVLNSLHNRNALSLQLLNEMLGALSCSNERPARALILLHRGPVFCSGIDLREMNESADRSKHSKLLVQFLRGLCAYPAPVICGVAGAVRGGGMGVVGCSDIVIASRDSTFAYSEVRVGVVPAIVTTAALRKTSPGVLLPWLLTADPFDAPTAQSIGLVAQVANDAVEAAIARTAASILMNGPRAVAMTKTLAWTLDADFSSALAEAEVISGTAFSTEEASRGIAAFRERRRPAWHSDFSTESLAEAFRLLVTGPALETSN